VCITHTHTQGRTRGREPPQPGPYPVPWDVGVGVGVGCGGAQGDTAQTRTSPGAGGRERHHGSSRSQRLQRAASSTAAEACLPRTARGFERACIALRGGGRRHLAAAAAPARVSAPGRARTAASDIELDVVIIVDFDHLRAGGMWHASAPPCATCSVARELSPDEGGRACGSTVGAARPATHLVRVA
jgi:hypothetical protein